LGKDEATKVVIEVTAKGRRLASAGFTEDDVDKALKDLWSYVFKSTPAN
jgi:hypothetical protein